MVEEARLGTDVVEEARLGTDDVEEARLGTEVRFEGEVTFPVIRAKKEVG
jgi:hypothetical protein